MRRLLQKTHFDGHLRLMYAPGFAQQLSGTSNRAERQRVGDSLQLIDWHRQNFTFTTAEILLGNIGYVKFNAFVGFLDEARPNYLCARNRTAACLKTDNPYKKDYPTISSSTR
jgi:retinol-binding protein 3